VDAEEYLRNHPEKEEYLVANLAVNLVAAEELLREEVAKVEANLVVNLVAAEEELLRKDPEKVAKVVANLVVAEEEHPENKE